MLDINQRIYALLFVSAEPITARAIAAALEIAEEDVVSQLAHMREQSVSSGIQIQLHGHTYQLVSSPEASDDIKRLQGQNQKTDLSRPALETLAIIAYEGPISRDRIDEIRGVNSESMLKNLLNRELVLQSFTPTGLARYNVSHSFLQTLGITSVDELPPLSTNDPSNSEN